MAFQPATGIAQAEFRMLWDGQKVENVLNFKSNSPLTAEALGALADELSDAWATHCIPLMSFNAQYESCHVRSLESLTAPATDSFVGGGAVGANPTASMPNNVSLAIKFLTGLSGKSGRGRLYIVGMPRGEVTNNVVSATLADAWVTALNAVFDAAAGLTWQPVVLSRRTGGAARAVAVGYAITGIGYTDRIVDSQRRRLPQRGH